jgi:uncharacterized cupredoxin-like copper-binding protein
MDDNVVVRHLARLFLSLVVLTAVAACADDNSATGPTTPPRTIAIDTVEYDFLTDAPPDIVAGETITFVVTNIGEMPHEMQLLDDQGRQLGIVPALPPGGQGELTFRFEEAAFYQIICDIDDHLSLGQRKVFEVRPA